MAVVSNAIATLRTLIAMQCRALGMARESDLPRILDEIGGMQARILVLEGRPCPPPLPTIDARIAVLCAAGYGPLCKPLTRGLQASGLTHARAVEAVSERIRDGRVVKRAGGGWTVASVDC